MRVNCITNLDNGAGLQREYELLQAELTRRGHVVHGIHHKTPVLAPADLNIFLEVVVPSVFACAPRQWLVPDPEWFRVTWPLDVWDAVLTKTHDATRIFRAKVGHRCRYLGWAARDFYDPTIPRVARFLHVAGRSRAKNTPAVVEGARRVGVPLTVVTEASRVTDGELRLLLNSHAFCLLPSAYEGFGHSLHEAYGCAQVVLTTAAAPMNEVGPAILIPTVGGIRQHCGVLHRVTGAAVAQAIRRALALTPDERAAMGQGVRAAFERDRATFARNLDAELEAVA
jgi:hypothetical protein